MMTMMMMPRKENYRHFGNCFFFFFSFLLGWGGSAVVNQILREFSLSKAKLMCRFS